MNNLNPREVFDIFAQINQVPRPSKHEERMSQWLQDFAHQHNIECVVDEAMNVIMRKPATPGYEDHDGVILQAHQDMVCEKNSDVEHDFLHDPIQTYVDGEFLKAKGTTLGADDGIGVAMALAIMTDPDLKHPALECLFTVDEETGLTGAFKLKDGYLKGKRLINIDSEDDGQIFIGCAGGIDTLAKMHYTPQPIPNADQWQAVRLVVNGLLGGHSGDDINKGRGNANKIIVNFLYALQAKTDFLLASINGGNLRNAIAREAEAVICVPKSYVEKLSADWSTYAEAVPKELAENETGLNMELQNVTLPTSVLPDKQAHQLILALFNCPHGMIAMCKDMPGLVETSTNLASIKMKCEPEGTPYVEINTSQRSSVEAEKHHIKNRVEHSLAMACDEVTHGDGYPGWAPNVHSALLDITKSAYVDLFGSDPQVLAIHAGLECGLFLEKYPYLDMVSVGPQMYGVHSPQERLSIPSTERCYRWIKHILELA